MHDYEQAIINSMRLGQRQVGGLTYWTLTAHHDDRTFQLLGRYNGCEADDGIYYLDMGDYYRVVTPAEWDEAMEAIELNECRHHLSDEENAVLINKAKEVWEASHISIKQCVWADTMTELLTRRWQAIKELVALEFIL